MVERYAPVEINAGFSAGTLMPSYFDDYYNRFHILPTPVDVGNMTSETEQSVEVWNAYLSTKHLAGISEAGASGMALTQPISTPTDFAPLESRLYTLTVSLSGPANINGAYTFDFPDYDPVLSVIGSRIITWAFRPNWKQPVNERLAWLTDVIEAEDSTEQRIALREIPRREMDYTVTLSAESRRRMEAKLWDWQARLFALPIWTDGSRIDAAAAVGATALSFDTATYDYVDGGLVALIAGPSSFEVTEIHTVDAGGLTLASPLQMSWPTGTRVFPARLARLQDAQALNLHTATVLQGIAQFRIEDNSAIAGAELSATLYRGYPVLEHRPNWREPLTVDYNRKLKGLDNRTGVPLIEDMSGRPSTLQDFLWTRKGRADIHTLRQWFHARQGRYKRIWLPTYQHDLVVNGTTGSGDPYLQVEHVGYTQHLQGKIGRRDLRICLKDGTEFYRRIDSSVEVDSTQEQLNLDASFGREITPNDVRSVSYLQLSRLASDAVDLAWHTPEAQECRHRMRGLNHDV